MLTHERLKEVLTYNPETGTFFWKVSTSKKIKPGDVAGCYYPDWYVQIRIDGTSHLAHRLAWFYTHGVLPDMIDHRDGDRHNNRLTNLRLTNDTGNARNMGKKTNSKMPYKGIAYEKRTGRWMARIRTDAGRVHLGTFDTPEEAAAAYDQASLRHHGEFARPNV